MTPTLTPTFLDLVRSVARKVSSQGVLSLKVYKHGSYLWTTLYLQKKSLEFRIIKLKTQKKEKFIMNVVS